MGLTGVTHLLTCLLGAPWRGLAQGPLRVPYMERGWSISVEHAQSMPSRRPNPRPGALLRLPSRPGSCCAVTWFALSGLFLLRRCGLLAYFRPQAPSRRARSPASVWERPQRARLSKGILAAREALDGS